MKLTDKVDSILKQKSGEVWSVSPDHSLNGLEIRECTELRKELVCPTGRDIRVMC